MLRSGRRSPANINSTLCYTANPWNGTSGCTGQPGKWGCKSIAKAKWELPKWEGWEKPPLAALPQGSDVKLRVGLRERQKPQLKRGWKGLTKRKLGAAKDLGLQQPSTGMTLSSVQL